MNDIAVAKHGSGGQRRLSDGRLRGLNGGHVVGEASVRQADALKLLDQLLQGDPPVRDRRDLGNVFVATHDHEGLAESFNEYVRESLPQRRV